MIFGAIGEAAIGDYAGGNNIVPISVASAEAFSTDAVVSSDAYILSPSSVASAEAFGTPSLTYYISPTSIASAEAFGALTVFLHITYLPVSRSD